MSSLAGARQDGITRLLCVTLNTGDVYPGLQIEGYYGSYQHVYTLDWGQAGWTCPSCGN